jgi:2-C-methyl-D-erythritol 4-phosphate cytidylyltransferase
MKTPCNVCAIIVAAGESRRMNGVDKVMAPLAGKPVLARALAGKPVLARAVEPFQNSELISRIIIVSSEINLDRVRQMAATEKWTKVSRICPGGKRRQDSVAAGLAQVESAEWVMIQDGARPLVTAGLIQRGLDSAQETGSAIPAVPVSDTIKIADDNMWITETPPRQNLWAIQTPQVFRFAIIKEAYARIKGDVTDDASLVEQLGYKVKLFPGSLDNIKITNPRDLVLAECLVKQNGR